MYAFLMLSLFASSFSPPVFAQRDAPKRVAYCLFENLSGDVNLEILAHDDGSLSAVTRTGDSTVTRRVRITGGFSDSSVLNVPVGIFVKVPSDSVYTVVIRVWKNQMATGDLTTPPVLPGLENHVEPIKCPEVNI